MSTTAISARPKVYVRLDGWRGYFMPRMAVGCANDTGEFSDSPCPSSVSKREIDGFCRLLRKAGIPYKRTTGGTSNIFCGKRYVLVSDADRAKAIEIAKEYQKETALFYVCEG